MDKIGICGAGLIGASWAIGFANAGFKCFVYDKNQNSFARFKETSNKLIQDLRIINPDIEPVRINSNIKLNCNIKERVFFRKVNSYFFNFFSILIGVF